MTEDPLTDQLLMRCLCIWRHWYLFDEQGDARVLRRRRYDHRDKNGKVTKRLDVEWGALDGDHITDEARTVLYRAWDEHLRWKEANQ